MKADDYKLLIALFFGFFLIGMVILTSPKRELGTTGYEKVDLKKLEKLVSEGEITVYPARFYKKLKSLEEAE